MLAPPRSAPGPPRDVWSRNSAPSRLSRCFPRVRRPSVPRGLEPRHSPAPGAAPALLLRRRRLPCAPASSPGGARRSSSCWCRSSASSPLAGAGPRQGACSLLGGLSGAGTAAHLDTWLCSLGGSPWRWLPWKQAEPSRQKRTGRGRPPLTLTPSWASMLGSGTSSALPWGYSSGCGGGGGCSLWATCTDPANPKVTIFSPRPLPPSESVP